MSCQICYQKFTKRHNFLRLHCACQVCRSCYADSLKEQLKSYGLPAFKVTCPVLKHNNELSSGLLRKILRREDYEYYESVMAKRKMLEKDYVQCPTCSTVGWRDSDYCFTSCTCRSCGETLSKGLLMNPFSLFAYLEEVKVVTKKELTANPCPHCNVWIEKNMGCNHMTCTNCRWEFCWQCKGNYHAHNYTKCSIQGDLKGFWTFIVIVVAILKLGKMLPLALGIILLFHIAAVALFIGIISFGCMLIAGHLSAFSNGGMAIHGLLLAGDCAYGAAAYIGVTWLGAEILSVLGLAAATLLGLGAPSLLAYIYLAN